MDNTTRPRVFIGSSTEGLEVANAIQETLEHFAETVVWTQGVFQPSVGVLEKLTAALPTFDFGIFVFSADDIVSLRADTKRAVRDNVIFEMGLFVGNLGRERTFFVVPRGSGNLRIPTDLAGIVPATYDPRRQDANLTAALGPACNKMRRVLQELGPLNLRMNQVRRPELISSAPAGTPPTHVRRDATISQLRVHLDELKKVVAEVNRKHDGRFESMETKLTRWKSRVTRFIDSHISLQEAIAFAGIHTTLGGAMPSDHFDSSVNGHVSFLEALIEEIEADSSFPLRSQPRQSNSARLVVRSFTYNT